MYVETLLLHLWFRRCGILQTELKPSKGGQRGRGKRLFIFRLPLT